MNKTGILHNYNIGDTIYEWDTQKDGWNEAKIYAIEAVIYSDSVTIAYKVHKKYLGQDSAYPISELIYENATNIAPSLQELLAKTKAESEKQKGKKA